MDQVRPEEDGPGDTPVDRGLALVLGLLCVLVGAFLTFRPFGSLAVLVVSVAVALLLTGATALLTARRTRDRGDLVEGLLAVAAGVAVLAWPGLTVRGIALLVGVVLVLSGLTRFVRAVRGSVDERVAAGLGGAASFVLGVLALGWPDVTVFVVAVLFGARTVLVGLTLLVAAVRGRRRTPSAGPRPTWQRWARSIGAAAALVVALGLLSVSSALHADTPAPDAFYDTPSSLPDQPGRLLRAEPFDREVPDGARGWRILYTTTAADGSVATASGLVVSPADDGRADPVIAWAHGTTGVVRGCAPSVLDEPFESGAFFLLDEVVTRGWTLVATDYTGLGAEGEHPYLVGEPAGRSVLDAVRAARQLDGTDLAEQTVVWGHSQGGGAALWTGQLASSYAPDTGVVGVAALAPASDLSALVTNLENVPAGEIFASYVMAGYSSAYPDVEMADYVRPSARILVREMATRCLAEKSALVSVLSTFLLDRSIFSGDVTAGPFAERLAENVPTDPIQAPLLLAQGETDPLVLPAAQSAYAARRCEIDGNVDYRTYPGRDHVGLVAADSPLVPELLSWTEDRFAGRPASGTCGS